MKRYIWIALSAFLLVGCTKDVSAPIENYDPDEIRLDASYPGTKATLDTFEIGDLMGFYAVECEGDSVLGFQLGGNYLNNERMNYDGTQWKGVRPVYWSTKSCDFYGYYPYMKVESIDAQLFNLKLDQSQVGLGEELDAYEASDLLWAKATKISRTDSAVPMEFKHLMSRAVIKIVKGPQYPAESPFPNDIKVHIYNTVTSASVNFKKGSLEKNPYGNREPITAKQLSADTFVAIIVPQHIERSTPLIEITMGGISYLLEYSCSFRPGRQHNFNVIVNKSPEQEKIEISIDGEVQPWN